MTARRRRLYLAGVVPSVLALLLAGQLWWRVSLNDEALAHHGAGEYAAARTGFADRPGPELVERWVPPFNEGGARFALDDFAGAVVQWQAALDHAPAERVCDVRTNLALAHEQLAQQAADDLDRAGADEALRAGLEALADCDGADARSVRDRLTAALAASGGGSRDDADPAAPDPAPADPRAGELEERNEQAERDQQGYDDLDDYPSGEWSEDYQW